MPDRYGLRYAFPEIRAYFLDARFDLGSNLGVYFDSYYIPGLLLRMMALLAWHTCGLPRGKRHVNM